MYSLFFSEVYMVKTDPLVMVKIAYALKNTSRIHLTEWNKEIFDAPTLDLLMMSPWFCGEAARIFRDCPHLVGNWLTASWLNKARALGTLK